MLRIGHRSALFFSGLSWLGIGILLLYKGFCYLLDSTHQFAMGEQQGFSLIGSIDLLIGRADRAPLILMAFALFFGMIKGHFVLRKTARRIVKHIRARPSPFALSTLYPRRYYFLLGSMALLGMSFKFLPLPLDIKGFIDFAVGAALVNGSFLYSREGWRT